MDEKAIMDDHMINLEVAINAIANNVLIEHNFIIEAIKDDNVCLIAYLYLKKLLDVNKKSEYLQYACRGMTSILIKN
jgi:hypothetical protein